MRKQLRGAPSAGKVSLPPLSVLKMCLGLVAQAWSKGRLHLIWLPMPHPSITLHCPCPQLTCW